MISVLQNVLIRLPLVSKISRLALSKLLFQLGRPVLLSSLLITSSILAVRHLGALERLELAVYDQLVSLRPDEELDSRLLIVGVTERDIQNLGEWPLRDRTVAQLIARLQQYSPRVISLDIMRDVAIEPGREQLLQELATAENIIAVCKASDVDSIGVPPPPGLGYHFIGFSDLAIDPGGVLRRTLMWMDPPIPAGGISENSQHLCSGPDTVISLSLQTAFQYLASEQIYPELTDTGELRLGDRIFPALPKRFGGYQVADTSGYQLMLNYQARQQSAPTVSLADVMDGQIDPALIRDRIVLIGYLTPQAGDDFYTPYSQSQNDGQKMSGVEIHAQAISQILGAVLEGRPLIWVWSPPVEAIWILLWAITGGLLAWYIRRPWRLSLAVLGTAAGLSGFCFLSLLWGGWIPLAPPVLAMGATATAAIIILNQRLKAENLRIKTELDITRQLQQMLLPPEEELQHIQGLDIAGYMEPCDDVGGDYYDVLPAPKGYLKIGIGDVTGHGLESGLMMLMVQTAVRTLVETDENSPEKFLSALNRSIYQNVQRINSSKTMTLSLLDYKDGTIYLSGQHEDVLIVRADGTLEKIDTVNLGFPIALEEDIDDFLDHIKIDLRRDDVVVLYTDGITEARNPEREFYGLERLCRLIQEHHRHSAQDIREAVIQDVTAHIDRQNVTDDITLLVLKQR